MYKKLSVCIWCGNLEDVTLGRATVFQGIPVVNLSKHAYTLIHLQMCIYLFDIWTRLRFNFNSILIYARKYTGAFWYFRGNFSIFECGQMWANMGFIIDLSCTNPGVFKCIPGVKFSKYTYPLLIHVNTFAPNSTTIEINLSMSGRYLLL